MTKEKIINCITITNYDRKLFEKEVSKYLDKNYEMSSSGVYTVGIYNTAYWWAIMIKKNNDDQYKAIEQDQVVRGDGNE